MADERDAPDAPLQHVDPAAHRREIALRANRAFNKNGSNGMLAPLRLAAYAFADLPDPALWQNALLICSDEVGGATICFSDGTDWRRATDLTVASDT